MRTRFFASLLLLATAATLTLTAAESLNYIYKRGDQSYIRMNDSSFERLKAVSKKYGEEFIWVRQEGRTWVIRDARVLAEARTLFREMDVFSAPLEAAQKRLRPYEKQMETVEKKMDAISDAFDDEDLSESEREALEDRLRVAEEEVRKVEVQMETVEREMERIEREMEKVEEEVERRFEQLLARAIRQGAAERP